MKTLFCLITLGLTVSAGYGQSAKEYLDRGIEKNKLKNFGDAIAEFTKSIEAEPQYADAYFLRGTLKNILDDYPGAIADLNKALEIKSENDNIQKGKEGSKDTQNQISEDLNSNKVKTVIRNNSCPYCHLGYANAKLDNPVAAVSYYSKAIEADPKRGESYYRRGLVKLLTGKREEGCLDLKQASELGYKAASEASKNYCP
jgi:tetratricopeptide (TPR) repeat protein